MKRFLNKYVWHLILLVGGFGVLAISNDFDFSNLVGSLNNGLILSSSNEFADAGSFGTAIFMEAFCSIHMSVFVLIPLSKIISKDNDKKVFITLFVIRVIVLLIGDLVAPVFMAMIDFFSVFIGAFILIPISAAVTGTKINHRSNQVIDKEDEGPISFEDFGANFESLDAGIEFAKTEIGDINVLIKSLIMQYSDINRAFYVKDKNKLRDLCSSDVYMDYKVKLDLYESVNEKPILDDVDFYDVKLTKFKKNDKEIIAELTIKYTCLHFVLDQNNRVVRGSNVEYKDIMKKITFCRKLSNNVTLKCNNCGASVSGNVENCEYCGSTLNYKVGDWVFIGEKLIYERTKG